MPRAAKHPLAEPSTWILFRALQVTGYGGRALRPVQIWNLVWITGALVGVFVFVVQRSGSLVMGLGSAWVLASLHATLHFATDPFLFYWPPALALMTWSLYFACPGPWPYSSYSKLLAAVLCAFLATLYNPMCGVGFLLVCWLWNGENGRKARMQKLVVALAGTALVVLLHSSQDGKTLSGPFGHWSEESWGQARRATREAIVARGPNGVTPLAALGRCRTIDCISVTAAYFGIGVLLVLTGLSAVTSKRSLRETLVFGGLAVGVAGFLLWFNPGQPFFWILPIWIVVLGAASGYQRDSIGRNQGWLAVVRRLTPGATLLQGGVLLLANSMTYVVPNSKPGTRVPESIGIASHFSERDDLVFALWPDNYISYFGGISCWGFLGISMHRNAEESTFEVLRRMERDARVRGGSLYVEIPQDLAWIPEQYRELPTMDYTETDFGRLRFGDTVRVGCREFREVVEVSGP